MKKNRIENRRELLESLIKKELKVALEARITKEALDRLIEQLFQEESAKRKKLDQAN